MAFTAIGGAIAGSLVGGLLSDGSSSGGGGGSGSGSGVSPGQEALANEQTSLMQYLRSRMQNTYAPLEDQFIAEAAKAGTPEQIAAKTGAAHGTAMQAQALATKTTAAELRRRGIAPNSPMAAAFVQDANTAAAATDAAAQTAARDTEINRGLALKQAAIGIGRGLDTTAASAGNAASNALSAGASQFNASWNRGRTAGMDAGYAVAPIARAVGTAATGWANSNAWSPILSGGGNSYTPNGYTAPTNSGGGQYGDYWGGDMGANFKDGGVIPMVRRGTCYADGGIVLRAGMDAQAQADLQVAGVRKVAEPAPAAPMSQTQFSNAGAGPRRLTDAEREAVMQRMDKNRPPPKKKYADGDVITGPGGPTDDAVPALVDGQQPIAVSAGEAIINETATREVLGAPLVAIINALGVLRRTVEQSGRVPAMAGARG